MNAPFTETVISGQKGVSIQAVVEDAEFDGDFGRKMSRAISIVSVDDEKVSSEKEVDEPKDEEFEKLMQRIQRQRNALDEILGHEAKVESIKQEAKTAEINITKEVVEEEEEEHKETESQEEETPAEHKETEVQDEESEPEASEEEEVKVEKVEEPEKKLVEEEVETEKVEQPEGSPISFLQIFIDFLILNENDLLIYY